MVVAGIIADGDQHIKSPQHLRQSAEFEPADNPWTMGVTENIVRGHDMGQPNARVRKYRRNRGPNSVRMHQGETAPLEQGSDGGAEFRSESIALATGNIDNFDAIPPADIFTERRVRRTFRNHEGKAIARFHENRIGVQNVCAHTSQRMANHR